MLLSSHAHPLVALHHNLGLQIMTTPSIPSLLSPFIRSQRGGGGPAMLSSHDNMLLRPASVDRRWKPKVEVAPNCPRCDSSNTKFCYYNNYSLSQPRYFCKGCRRYWTKGGSLRNVPVGGGCRKNRRGKSVRLSSAAPVGGRDVASRDGRLPTGPIRPDLMLNDMVRDSVTGDAITPAGGGSAIDLEVLYAKYLNQGPQMQPDSVLMPESQAAEVDHELLVSVATSSESSSCNQIPVQLPHQQAFLECHSIITQPMEEALLNDQVDQSYLSVDLSNPLALPVEPVNNCISLDCLSSSNLVYEEFESVPVGIMHHQQSLVDDDWSSLDYSSLEAFYIGVDVKKYV